MGCAASIGISGRRSPGTIGPDPRILHMLPAGSAAAAVSPASATPSAPPVSAAFAAADAAAHNSSGNSGSGGRRLTMKHTPKLDTEPAQRLQSLVLEMSKTGRLELTSVASRDDSCVEVGGTLAKAQLPALQQIPGVVFGMSKLLELNLRCNELRNIPKEIALLRALEVLDVAKNHLTELPHELGDLKRLKTLDVSENQLKRLPDEIDGLARLETLRASRNRLAALPTAIRKCARLKVLNLYNNVILNLGDGVSELCELEELNVSNNLLAFFPDVTRWKKLRELYLQVNKLLVLPALDALCNLELLTVQQNALKAFPSMDALVHIRKIDANTNQIVAIPSCFERMTALAHLSLRKNLVTVLPPFLCRCKSLEILDLGHNPLRGPVPADLVTLPHLKTFLIDGTLVTAVPIELMGLQQVCRVNLGSCLQMDDQETCEVVMELRSRCAQNGGWFKTG